MYSRKFCLLLTMSAVLSVGSMQVHAFNGPLPTTNNVTTTSHGTMPTITSHHIENDRNLSRGLMKFVHVWGQAQSIKEKEVLTDSFMRNLDGRIKFYVEAHNLQSDTSKQTSYAYQELMKLRNHYKDLFDAANGSTMTTANLYHAIKQELTASIDNTDNMELQFYFKDLTWFAADYTVQEFNRNK